MEDLIGVGAGIIAIFLVIKAVLEFIGKLLGLAAMALLWPIINFPVMMDKILGSYPILDPAWSWTLFGFFIGGSLYFMINEANKLQTPTATFLALTCLSVVLIGPTLMQW